MRFQIAALRVSDKTAEQARGQSVSGIIYLLLSKALAGLARCEIPTTMPIYEYRCASCGHELESLQKFSDAPLADCPACHEAHLKKKVSAAGFHLKGSGWYATDFRNSGGKPPAKDAVAKDGAGKAGAKANGGDGKPEAKSGDGGAVESSPAATTPAHPSTGASERKPASAASSDKTNP
jgi:putative FmdB family regulatory protein